ncbi:beta strand repeat-containing protein, partial [Humibacillus xanthopallidus]|uniref:beta strand repeat-containing protein n=1 Tax=Humibacillus xanthopallidus TaxID=412689 RepID=UPI0011527B37
MTATPSPRLGAAIRPVRFVAAGTALILGVAGVPAAVATAAAAPATAAPAAATGPVAPPLTPAQQRAGQVASQVAGVADWFLKIDDAVATQQAGYAGAKLAQSGAVAMAKAVNKAVAAGASSRTVSVGSPSRLGGAVTTTGARTLTTTTLPGGAAGQPGTPLTTVTTTPKPPTAGSGSATPTPSPTSTGSTGSQMHCVRSADGNSVTCTSGTSPTGTPTPTATTTATPTPTATATPSTTTSSAAATTATPTSATTTAAPALLTASSAPETPVGPDAAITDADLNAVVATVEAEWQDAYPSADFSGFSAHVGDLPDLQLGSEGSGSVTIDVDAAGWGWGSGGMSLKTAVRHEMGHYLGLGHSSGLMGSTLSPGESWPVDASNLPKPDPAPAPTADPAPTSADSTSSGASSTGTTSTDTAAMATTAATTDSTATSDPTPTDPTPTADPTSSTGATSDPTATPDPTGTSGVTSDPTAGTDPTIDPIPAPDTSGTPLPPAPTASGTTSDTTSGTAASGTTTTTTTTAGTGTTTTTATTGSAATTTDGTTSTAGGAAATTTSTTSTTGATTPATTLAWKLVGGVLTLDGGSLPLVGTISFDRGSNTVTFSPAGGGVAVVGSTLNISLVRIIGGAGDDDLTFDVPATGVFFAFDGGGGANTVRGPPTDTTWTISGPDAGSFGVVSFTHVGHLVGAPDTKDTFTLGTRGSLSAGLDGGARGFDSLVVSGRRGVVGTTAVDHSTGTLTIDGTLLRYAGLEPISVATADVTVTGTAGNDTIHVAVSGTTLSVSSPTIETLNIAVSGLAKLTIDGLGGTDSITFDTDLLIPGLVLDVTAETITVGSVVINTTGGATSGEVHLRAVATDNGTGTAVIHAAPGATISLTGATIRSGDISIDASASSTISTATPITKVTINSSATVTITDSTLASSGDIQATSTSTVTADLESGALAGTIDNTTSAALAILTVTTTAITTLSGTTTFTAGGDVVVSAATPSDLTAVATALEVGGGAGVAFVTLVGTSQALVDAHSSGNTAKSLEVTSDATHTITTTGVASQGGATSNSDSIDWPVTPAQLLSDIATTLSPLQVAASVAVTRVTTTSDAAIAPATGAFSLTTPAAGSVLVHAANSTTATTLGDASAVFRSASGIGAAVAVAIANAAATARLGGNLSLTTGSVTVEAPDGVQTFDTKAASGVGGSVTAVALPGGSGSTFSLQGSVAVNVVTATSSATLSPSASLSAPGANVKLASSHTTSSTVTARPIGPFFTPQTNVEADNKTFVLPLPLQHGNGLFAKTFEKVAYSNGGGVSMGGLTMNSQYYLWCPHADTLGFCLPDADGKTRIQLISGSLLIPPVFGTTPDSSLILTVDPSVAEGSDHFFYLVDSPGDAVGIGVGVGVNIVNDSDSATIGNGATLTGAHDLTLEATTDSSMTTFAKSASAGAIAVTPVVAVGISNVFTHADLGTGSLLTLTGAYAATATQTAGVDSSTSGDTTSNGAIGASVAINTADHEVTAKTARSLTTVGSAAFTASGASTTSSYSWAGTAGAPDKDTSTSSSVNGLADSYLTMGNNLAGTSGAKKGKDSTTPTAGTAENSGASLSVAAAIAFNLVRTVSDVSLPGSVTITVDGGPLTLSSSANTDASATGDGETGTNGAVAAIGAGVGLNLATVDNLADIAAGATVHAVGVTMGATMTPTGDTSPTSCDDPEADCTHTIEAGAVSASSGGGKLGVAGSVAINIVTITTSAQVKSATGLTTTVDARGGALALGAHSGSAATASATPYRDAFDPADILTDSAGKLTTIRLPYELADGNVKTGDKLVYFTGGGDPIGIVPSSSVLLCQTVTGLNPDCALKNNYTYFAIVERPGYIQLADSFANAILGIELEFDTTKTTGTAHYFVVVDSGGDNEPPKMGIGASFGMTIDNVTTTAAVMDNVVLTDLDSLEIVAETEAETGAEAVSGSGGGIAISPSVGLTLSTVTTSARLGTGATLVVPGEVTLEATQHTATETIGRGDVDAETAGIALALALAIVEDEVTANVARNVTASAVSLSASGSSANDSVTDAAAPGAPKDPNAGVNKTADKWLGQGNAVSTATTGKSSKSSSTPAAATSDGSVSVAGAVTINIVTTVSKAWLSDGLTVTATDGPVTLASSANTDVAGEAKGTTATKTGVGIGAGVVVNLVTMTNLATTGASTVDAHGLDVLATMTQVDNAEDPTAEPDVTHTIKADATAGASNTTDLGVAGALALNIVTASTQALVPAGATLVMHDGDITLTAAYAEVDVAGASANPTFKACAQVLGLPCLISKKITGENTDGAGVGIGAAAAIQVLASTVTKAEIADGVSLTGGHDVTISATSERWISTIAEAGAKGGTAVSPAVALIVNSGESTTARLGTGPAIDINGALTIEAVHTSDLTETQANGDVKATNVGVGMAIALPIVIGWTTLAELSRSATVDSASITAESRIAALAQANASSVGQAKTSTTKTADATATDTVKNDPNAGGKGADAPPKANDAAKAGSSASSAQSGQGSSSVGIAAAFGVVWVQSTNIARVVNGVTIDAAGPITVGAYQLTDITSRGTGTSLNTDANSTGFGIGVGFAHLDIASSALVGTGTTLSGDAITVEATTPLDETTGLPLGNAVTVWGIAAAGGKGDPQIAGSAGIIVVKYVTTASVGAGSTLTSTGDLTVRATNPMGMQNLALAAGLASNGQGVGAAIAITVLTAVTTTALIDSSAATPTTTNASGATTVEATAHLSPLPFDIIHDLLSEFADTIKSLPVLGMDSLQTPPFSSVALGGGAGSGDLGVGGSFVVIVGNRSTSARIGTAALVNQTDHGDTGQSVTVLARDDVSTIAIAGGIGLSTKGTGVGVAVIVAVTNQDVRAGIANGAKVWAGGDVRVRAIATDPVLAAAASLGVAKQNAAAGSFIVIVQNQGSGAPGTYASLGGGASAADRVTVTAGGDLEVSARSAIDDAGKATTIRLYAGGLAIGAGNAGIGLAASVLVRASRVSATTGQGATLAARAATASTTPGLTVSATQLGDIMLIAIAGGAGKSVGIAGSTTVNVLTDTTTASIGADSQVNQANAGAPGRQDVVVIASDRTTIVAAAGMVAIGGTAGIGAGADVEVITKTTTSSVGDRTRITANGDVVVSAVSSEKITSISVGGAVGGDVAIALNAGVSVMTVTTTATLGASTVVVAGGNVLVTADEVLELLIVAGNVTASGSASVGAGAAVPVLTKTTTATVGDGAKVTAYGLVGRVAHGTVNSGGYTMTQQDPRFDPRGFTDGNPVPQGLDPSDPNHFAIVMPTPHGFSTGQQVIYDNGGGADITGLHDGNTYYVNVLTPTRFTLSLTARGPPLALSLPNALMGESQRLVPTNSAQPTKDASPRFIPAKDVSGNTITLPYSFITPIATGDAVIYSSGGGTPIGGLTDGQTYYAIVLATTGPFGAQQIRLATTRDRAISGLAITLTASAATGTSHSLVPSGVLPAPDPRTTNPQTATLTTQTGFSGVAVTATNSDSINAIGISAGVSGSVAVNVSGTVSVITVTTTASIGASARVNCASESDCSTNVAGADPAQSVIVLAGNSFHQLGIAAAAAGAGSVAAGAGVAVGVIEITTTSSIGNTTVVNAKGDIVVEADASESFVSVAASAAIGGDAGLAGAVGVTVLDLTTSATTGTGVTLRADNNVLVIANDTTDLVLVAASLGAGVWAGLGAGVSVAVVTKTTEAHLGGNNVVVVLAKGAAASGISDGTSTAAGSFGTKSAFHGLAVQADSSEELFGLTAGIAGGFVGIAGGIGVNIFTVVVKAFIAGGTTVNKGTSGIIAGVASGQSVVVAATDYLETLTIAGGVGIGAGGIGGGVDVGVANITVQAYLGVGSDVWADGTVEIDALATKHVQTYAVSLGGGVVGVAGSVTVWTVGTAATNTYQSAVSGPDRGVWSSGTTYEAGDIVSVGGVKYFARSRNVGKNPTSNPTVWVPRAWSSTVTYEAGDVVTYSGKTYAAKTRTVGDTPSSSPGDWALGDQSPTGTSTGSADSLASGGDTNGGSGNGWGSVLGGSGSIEGWVSGTDYVQGQLVSSGGHYYVALTDITNSLVAPETDAASATPSWALSDDNYQVRQLSSTSDASSSVTGASPGGSVASSPFTQPAPPSGTSATIYGSVHAGGDVQVRATDRIDVTSLAGVAAVGLGALGAGVSIVTLGLSTDAGIASTGSVSSGATVGVHAVLDERVDGLAAAGALGGLAISGQVVVITDSSSQSAHIDTGATVPKAVTKIAVDTVATRTISARTFGVSIAAGAVGAAIAVAVISGDTTALVGDVAIGADGAVGGLIVSSTDTIIPTNQAVSVQGGVGAAISGAVAVITYSGSTRAASGAHGTVTIGGLGVSVTATG